MSVVICQNCQNLHNFDDVNVAYVGAIYATYLCFDCTEHIDLYQWEQVAPVRTCSECLADNEFIHWCFTCESEKMFWRNRVS